MSLTHSISTLIGSASRASSNASSLISTSLTGRVRPTIANLSICSNCLRSMAAPWQPSVGQTTFVRGKKKLAKKVGIKVRFLKDVPRYGPKGSIMIVAPGRMRTIWYQRGEAEYITREKEKELGKHVVVERDPGYMPYVEKKEEVTTDGRSDIGDIKEKLLTPIETINILSTILPTTIRFYRSTVTPNSDALHGSVTTTDIANAIKLIASASPMKDANRVVLTAENITLTGQEEMMRIKQLGVYECVIWFRGMEETVTRTVTVVREEDEDAPNETVSKPVSNVSAGGSIFGGAPRSEL